MEDLQPHLDREKNLVSRSEQQSYEEGGALGLNYRIHVAGRE